MTDSQLGARSSSSSKKSASFLSRKKKKKNVWSPQQRAIVQSRFERAMAHGFVRCFVHVRSCSVCTRQCASTNTVPRSPFWPAMAASLRNPIFLESIVTGLSTSFIWDLHGCYFFLVVANLPSVPFLRGDTVMPSVLSTVGIVCLLVAGVSCTHPSIWSVLQAKH